MLSVGTEIQKNLKKIIILFIQLCLNTYDNLVVFFSLEKSLQIC